MEAVTLGLADPLMRTTSVSRPGIETEDFPHGRQYPLSTTMAGKLNMPMPIETGIGIEIETALLEAVAAGPPTLTHISLPMIEIERDMDHEGNEKSHTIAVAVMNGMRDAMTGRDAGQNLKIVLVTAEPGVAAGRRFGTGSGREIGIATCTDVRDGRICFGVPVSERLIFIIGARRHRNRPRGTWKEGVSVLGLFGTRLRRFGSIRAYCTLLDTLLFRCILRLFVK